VDLEITECPKEFSPGDSRTPKEGAVASSRSLADEGQILHHLNHILDTVERGNDLPNCCHRFRLSSRNGLDTRLARWLCYGSGTFLRTGLGGRYRDGGLRRRCGRPFFPRAFTRFFFSKLHVQFSFSLYG
jgi:hypothetical protein